MVRFRRLPKTELLKADFSPFITLKEYLQYKQQYIFESWLINIYTFNKKKLAELFMIDENRWSGKRRSEWWNRLFAVDFQPEKNKSDSFNYSYFWDK